MGARPRNFWVISLATIAEVTGFIFEASTVAEKVGPVPDEGG